MTAGERLGINFCGIDDGIMPDYMVARIEEGVTAAMKKHHVGREEAYEIWSASQPGTISIPKI